MEDGNSVLVSCQQDQLQLQTRSSHADLCSGEMISSSEKESCLLPATGVIMKHHTDRKSGNSHNKQKFLWRKPCKLSAHGGQIESVSQHDWINEEDSFLTDDEAEIDEDDQHNIYINCNTPRYSSRAFCKSSEGGDSAYRVDVIAKNSDWFDGYYSTSKKSCDEDSDDLSDSSVGRTPRLAAGYVYPAWMRVPSEGADALEFSNWTSRKDLQEEKKPRFVMIKRKRKKLKVRVRHPPDAGSSSEENLYPLTASGLRHSKTAGPTNWFRRRKISKNAVKISTDLVRSQRFPVDCMQVPAPEGSILKRPHLQCPKKLKKRVRWASDLMQVKYFRSEPVVPSSYYSKPRKQKTHLLSYDVDVLFQKLL